MDLLSQLEVVATVALAMLLGGVIGFEREVAHKPAGLRTVMLVAGAAALLVSLGDAVLARYVSPGWLAPAEGSGLRASEVIRSDPIRIIEAIIAGVSFLGAGTIFRGEKADRVEGLTTAASILFSAAVGVATALHQFAIAGGATLLALIALRGLLKLEKEVSAER